MKGGNVYAGDSILTPPAGGVALRMYRQGLGDCFLLAFSRGGGKEPAYALIDCGVHDSQRDGSENIPLVVDDLLRATQGHIDIAVASLKRDDHVSGFLADDRFGTQVFAIDQLWLAWAENEQDDQATMLKRSLRTARQAVDAALDRLSPLAQNDSNDGRSFRALSDGLRMARSFDGPAAPGDDASSNSSSESHARDSDSVAKCDQAMALLKSAANDVKFLEPGLRPIPIFGTDARVYVLGPPRAGSLSRPTDPTAVTGKETYLTGALGLESFAAAVTSRSDSDDDSEVSDDLDSEERHDSCFPFGRKAGAEFDGVQLEETESRSTKRIVEFYGEQDAEWRGIAHDWLFAAQPLAMQLDKHAGNTSLVLAFEIGEPGSGPVLLFPGDAQVGSWSSWKNLRWVVEGREVTAADLLTRTVIYKVAQHGGRDGTLRRTEQGEFGLSLMPDGVVGLLTVDEIAAAAVSERDLPSQELYDALLKKTRGNLLRSDEADTIQPRADWQPVPGMPSMRWRASTTKKSDGRPLFYDLKIAKRPASPFPSRDPDDGN